MPPVSDNLIPASLLSIHAFNFKCHADDVRLRYRAGHAGSDKHVARHLRPEARYTALGASDWRRIRRLSRVNFRLGIFSFACSDLANLAADALADCEQSLSCVPLSPHVAHIERASIVGAKDDRPARIVYRDIAQSESNPVRRHNFSGGRVRELDCLS